MTRGRLIIFSLLIMLAGIGRQIQLQYRSALILEALLILTMLYILASYKPIVKTFNALSGFHKGIVIIFVALFLVGHLSHKSHRTFPFVTWTMYGTVEWKGDPVFYEYIGKLENGITFRFIPARVLPTLAKSRIDNKLRRQINAIQTEKQPTQRVTLMSQHESTLAAFARLYNQKHPEEKIQSITVLACTIPINAYDGKSSIKRQILWEISVE